MTEIKHRHQYKFLWMQSAGEERYDGDLIEVVEGCDCRRKKFSYLTEDQIKRKLPMRVAYRLPPKSVLY